MLLTTLVLFTTLVVSSTEWKQDVVDNAGVVYDPCSIFNGVEARNLLQRRCCLRPL